MSGAMQIEVAFAAVYFVVFTAIAVGGWLYGRRTDPRVLKPWYPPFSLVSIAILGALLLGPPLFWGQHLAAAVAGVIIVAIAYFAVARTRVCESCGTVSPPKNLVTPVDSCPQCGAALFPNKIVAQRVERRLSEWQ
jgi:predicted RNA-binding Zn-ribbon protein involved in translation (DUF1610 family)